MLLPGSISARKLSEPLDVLTVAVNVFGVGVSVGGGVGSVLIGVALASGAVLVSGVVEGDTLGPAVTDALLKVKNTLITWPLTPE